MAIFSPRASRIAPSEADAIPLPREDSTPPVTNTKRVITLAGLPVACGRCRRRADRRRASRLSHRRGPHEARTAAGAGPRLYRLIDPEIGDGEQPGAAVDERQPRALAQGQLRLAQQALQRAPRPARSDGEPLAAAAPADREPCGKGGETDRPVRIGPELDLPEATGQGTGRLGAPAPGNLGRRGPRALTRTRGCAAGGA